MPLSPLTGTATSTAKISDVNGLITALNAEIDKLAAKTHSHDDLAARVTALEKDLADTIAKVGAVPGAIQTMAERVTAIEQTPMSDHGHGELDQRVDALENLVQRVPAENPRPPAGEPTLPKPAGLDREVPTLIYDRATIYYHDIELYAQRIGERRWRLFATLNYVVISPAVWTYDEIVEGTPEEVYAHALERLRELADLKPQHDAVHARVARMSEGEE